MTQTKSYTVDADRPAFRPLPAPAPPRCACGHELGHREVLPEPIYTTAGWLLFLIGVTAKPRAVFYRCLRCQQILGVTRDPAILCKFD